MFVDRNQHLLRLLTINCLMLTAVSSLSSSLSADEPAALPRTEPLVFEGDLSAHMRRGFDTFLRRELAASIDRRPQYWKPDYSSREAYEKSVAPNRERFRRMIGAIDERLVPIEVELVGTVRQPALLARTDSFAVYRARWPVFEGVHGEGLLLEPHESPRASIVALPDADQTPEMLVGLAEGIEPAHRFARALALQGCRVLVPVLVDRRDTWSGNPVVAMTNQPHREWIYRQAFEMGRHIIGYEVQKVLAAVDWFSRTAGRNTIPVGVAGYGEGALIAAASAAVDTRIDAALVSGWFNSRQEIADEPIYRNLFGLLLEFGDAELVSLIAPRSLVIEHSAAPAVDGPPEAKGARRGVAAPGRIRTGDFTSIAGEVERAARLFPAEGLVKPQLAFIAGPDQATTGPGSSRALAQLLKGLQISMFDAAALGPGPEIAPQPDVDAAARQERQVRELENHNQRLLRLSHKAREKFWSDADPSKGADLWPAQTARYRDILWDQIVGRFPPATEPVNPRSRVVLERAKWVAHEVVLDVYPDVICWGWLLVPRDIAPGERRPVVVCQHGLEGVPADTVTEDPKDPGYGPYKGFSARLADRGFVVYAPHNFYRGNNEFRQLQRLAHPLGKTLFGLTTIQHQRHLEWLSTLPFVDRDRIGFYGLSYGGNTAMRVPALLTQYSCVISSGDFNEWIFKNVTPDYVHSMIFHNVYEVFEWNLGHTFNHGDLAALIAPRPFMVERGHTDGVAIDEWVASEYARVRRLYAFLGIPSRTEIEFFNGPHTINGVATFEFLHRHLRFPTTP